jgi:hypothetical protein
MKADFSHESDDPVQLGYWILCLPDAKNELPRNYCYCSAIETSSVLGNWSSSAASCQDVGRFMVNAKRYSVLGSLGPLSSARRQDGDHAK